MVQLRSDPKTVAVSGSANQGLKMGGILSFYFNIENLVLRVRSEMIGSAIGQIY